MNTKSAKIFTVTLSVLVLLALLFACGGKSRVGSMRIAPESAAPLPPVELSIDDVLADIDAAEPPPGVDPAIYNLLKQALREQLISLYSGKIVCTPPTGPENEITDFAFESAGEDSFNFTWSYINVGDYDQDGTVGISDITPIAMFYGEPASTPDAEVVDGDGDGAIGISDITPLAIHYGNNVDHYVIRGTEDEGVEPDEEIGTVPFSEGTEGSRLRFSRIYFCGTSRFFRVFAVDSTLNIGAGSRTAYGGPSAQADAHTDGRDVQFYGVGSTPFSGNVFFLWDFESDGIFDTTGGGGGGGAIAVPDPDTSSGDQSPMHTYPADGTYMATLRVYDSAGNFSTATITVAAFDAAPTSAPPEVSALVLDLTGEAPFHVRFRSFSEDPDGGSILLYTWDFGDGSPTQVNATVDHTYTIPGTFTARLTVEDEEAQLSNAQLVIKVCPSGSIPDLHPSAVNVPFVTAGSSVVGFVGQSADMDGGPESYMWDFGDNSLPNTTQDPNHAYPGDGVYYATVHARDDESNHSTAGSTFIIGSPTDELPSAWVLAYITSGTQNMLVQFWGEGEFLDGRTVEYSWDFDGDGTYGDYSITDGDPIVAYTAVGNYQVGFKVMDAADHNKYSTASATITVHPCVMPTPPPPPPAEIPTVPIPTPPPLSPPINARCHPCPLSIAHGPPGGTLWLIYTDNGGMDPLAAGYPSLSQIQQFGPNPIAPWLWGPHGEIGNTGNGNAGADIAVPYPPGTAPPPPAGANVKPGESWTAYQISGPKDGPPRVVRQDIKFHLKRDDGSAFASQTCIVYIYHSCGEIQEPLSDEYVSGDVYVRTEVDPSGPDDWIGFIDLDPGDQISVYLEVDGTVVDPLAREGGTTMWSGMWDSTTVDNGPHTLRCLYYDTRNPQPGEPDAPDPFWETLPVTVNVDNAAGVATADFAPGAATNAGEPVHLELTTRDGAGAPIYDPTLEVNIEITPERSETYGQLFNEDAVPQQVNTHNRIFPMVDNGDGTYTFDFTPDIAGTYAIQAFIVDTDTGDKVPDLHPEATHDVIPTEIVELNLVSAGPISANESYGPVLWDVRDSLGNVVVPPDPSNFSVTSDNPSIQATGPEYFPDPADPSTIVGTGISATDWGMANWTIEHPDCVDPLDVFVGYPPWRPHFSTMIKDLPPGLDDGDNGIRADSFFDVYCDIRIPDGFPKGWQNFEFEVAWPLDAPVAFQSLNPELPNVELAPAAPYDDGMGNWCINVSGHTTDMSECFGEQTVFSLSFWSSDVATATPSKIGVVPMTISLQDSSGAWLYQDGGFFEGFYDFPFEVKPTKTLNMHIYRVEGSATDTEINDDVQEAEDMFNLNAFLCTLGFYVDFVPTIDTIPIADWNEIDEDGDGLDRYDANRDGDYADAGDNNDLFNAMVHDYYDVSANTENVYYVPNIRGGAMGTTYGPNGQVAVDNSKDSDNLTLAHEKVHEMDLRKDGDFDVLDGADMDPSTGDIDKDPTADAQGAYGANNIMNYGDTGPLLGSSQAAELDP